MAKLSLIIFSLVACFTYALAGDIIASRSFPSCGYVGEKIYCWGGDISATLNSQLTLDEDFYSLDINAFTGQKSDILISQWNKVTPKVPFWMSQRETPTSIALSDGKRFMIYGGFKTGPASKYNNQTVIYDASTNTWAKGTPYTVDNVGVKQIYSATAVNLPNGLVGFYGGFEQYANTSAPEISANGNAVTFGANNLSYVGFNSFITHNTDSGTWAPFSPQSDTLLDFYPTSQTATINPSTGKVYYLGGTYYTTTNNWAPINIPFSWAAVFDTKSGTWSNETLGGDIPTTRMYHTADLLPNSQDIILYGGSEDGKAASRNFCYTLNLETNTWTKHDNVNVPVYLSGPRFTHSGADGVLNPSLITLDVSSVSNILYAPNYASNAVTDSNKSDGLSKGAIGGITAGAIVIGLGIIAFVFFYLRRQKKAKGQDSTHEHMSVNWDEIEDRYKEVPAANSNFPQFTDATEITRNTGEAYSSPSYTETTAVDHNDFYHSANRDLVNVSSAIKPSAIPVTVKPDAK
ncbi:hypothetical protein EDC94DRAFT_580422 [Helicostylum pulchrum]|nr:hypothetical protein EDC94DRAFT_580422 [Helicostylum pulchrum]